MEETVRSLELVILIMFFIILFLRTGLSKTDHSEEYCYICCNRQHLRQGVDNSGRVYYICSECEYKVKKAWRH